jgi:hypothetical protein
MIQSTDAIEAEMAAVPDGNDPQFVSPRRRWNS